MTGGPSNIADGKHTIGPACWNLASKSNDGNTLALAHDAAHRSKSHLIFTWEDELMSNDIGLD